MTLPKFTPPNLTIAPDAKYAPWWAYVPGCYAAYPTPADVREITAVRAVGDVGHVEFSDLELPVSVEFCKPILRRMVGTVPEGFMWATNEWDWVYDMHGGLDEEEAHLAKLYGFDVHRLIDPGLALDANKLPVPNPYTR